MKFYELIHIFLICINIVPLLPRKSQNKNIIKSEDRMKQRRFNNRIVKLDPLNVILSNVLGKKKSIDSILQSFRFKSTDKKRTVQLSPNDLKNICNSHLTFKSSYNINQFKGCDNLINKNKKVKSKIEINKKSTTVPEKQDRLAQIRSSNSKISDQKNTITSKESQIKDKIISKINIKLNHKSCLDNIEKKENEFREKEKTLEDLSMQSFNLPVDPIDNSANTPSLLPTHSELTPTSPKLSLELFNFAPKNVSRFLIPFLNKFSSMHSLNEEPFVQSNTEQDKAFNLAKSTISNKCTIEYPKGQNMISIFFNKQQDYDQRDVVMGFQDRFKHYDFSKSIMENIRGAKSCGEEYIPFLNIATSPRQNEIGCAEVECRSGRLFICSMKQAAGNWVMKRKQNGDIYRDEWSFVLRNFKMDKMLYRPNKSEFVDIMHDQSISKGILGCSQRINGLTPDSLNKRYMQYCEGKCVDFGLNKQ